MNDSDPDPNPSPSPLSEADPESLDELFTRIDKKLILGLAKEITDSDIERVVKYYRTERVRFVQDQANFVRPGRKSGSGAGSKTKDLIERLSNTKLDFQMTKDHNPQFPRGMPSKAIEAALRQGVSYFCSRCGSGKAQQIESELSCAGCGLLIATCKPVTPHHVTNNQ